MTLILLTVFVEALSNLTDVPSSSLIRQQRLLAETFLVGFVNALAYHLAVLLDITESNTEFNTEVNAVAWDIYCALFLQLKNSILEYRSHG